MKAKVLPVAGLALGVSLSVQPAAAQNDATLNLYGVSGLIDMPTAEMQNDGNLNVSVSKFGPIMRSTLSFQITPRISGSFRFLGIGDFNKRFCPTDCSGLNQFTTYYDRSFDLRYLAVKEGKYLPAITIGMQDFVGTGIIAGEYVVATKHVTPDVKLSAGLGWGRLGSYSAIGTPLAERPVLDIQHGGNFNTDQWFRGPASVFGGIEWHMASDWTLKAEYSTDAYEEEAGYRQTFKRRSPVNFGVEYQASDSMRLGAYSMYGSEVGLAVHFVMDPKKRPGDGLQMGAPEPVMLRPSRSSAPQAWSSAWMADEAVGRSLQQRLSAMLEKEDIGLNDLRFDGDTAYVQLRNKGIDAEAQMIGRAARVMTVVMPASVERFVMVPVVEGMPVSQVAMTRRDVETLEFDLHGDEKIRAQSLIRSAPVSMPEGYAEAPSDRLLWALGPSMRTRLFDQKDPFKIGFGLELKGRYQLARGLSVSGSVNSIFVGNLDDRPPIPARNGLQPVRSAGFYYDDLGNPAVERLQLRYVHKLGSEIYGRISTGYLERMFAGISGEVLYLPTHRPWALGVELNYVKQRSPNGGFGFDLPAEMYVTDGCASPSIARGTCGARDSYSVATGHISGYYKLPNDFHVQLDVGRYLAGDVGATLSLKREFDNGWRVGAFVTKTDASAEQFGSGSFDKGITIEVPLTAILGKPSLKTNTSLIRPFGRDGGQRLDVEDRLYDTLRGYREDGLSEQWARFWK